MSLHNPNAYERQLWNGLREAMARSMHYSGMTPKTPEKTMKTTAIAKSRMANAKFPVRGHAERIEGTTKFRFFCPHGHSHVEDINKGRKGALMIGEFGCQQFSRYWTKAAGGVTFNCPGCKRASHPRSVER